MKELKSIEDQRNAAIEVLNYELSKRSDRRAFMSEYISRMQTIFKVYDDALASLERKGRPDGCSGLYDPADLVCVGCHAKFEDNCLINLGEPHPCAVTYNPYHPSCRSCNPEVWKYLGCKRTPKICHRQFYSEEFCKGCRYVEDNGCGLGVRQ